MMLRDHQCNACEVCLDNSTAVKALQMDFDDLCHFIIAQQSKIMFSHLLIS